MPKKTSFFIELNDKENYYFVGEWNNKRVVPFACEYFNARHFDTVKEAQEYLAQEEVKEYLVKFNFTFKIHPSAPNQILQTRNIVSLLMKERFRAFYCDREEAPTEDELYDFIFKHISRD